MEEHLNETNQKRKVGAFDDVKDGDLNFGTAYWDILGKIIQSVTVCRLLNTVSARLQLYDSDL